MSLLLEIRFFRLTGPTVALLLAACAASPGPVIERLDPVTGVTVSHARSPLMLYRDNPSQAAYARDFLQLGPIVVNRGGARRRFLWIGIWGTMQKVDATSFRDGFENVIVVVDGEPFTLELAGWTPDAIGLSESAYVKPVASTADAYYEVTSDQLRLIASAKDLRLHSTGTRPATYEIWTDAGQSQRSLALFLTPTAD